MIFNISLVNNKISALIISLPKLAAPPLPWRSNMALVLFPPINAQHGFRPNSKFQHRCQKHQSGSGMHQMEIKSKNRAIESASAKWQHRVAGLPTITYQPHVPSHDWCKHPTQSNCWNCLRKTIGTINNRRTCKTHSYRRFISKYH